MKEGQLFFTSRGEYSDYGIGSFFRAKKQFSFDAELDRWMRSGAYVKPYAHGYYDNSFNFFKHLEDNGFVEDLAVQEVHTHDYGSIQPGCANDRDDDVAG